MDRAVVFLNVERVLSKDGAAVLAKRPLFEGWLRFRADVDVVITSDRRRTQPLDRLRFHFQQDLQDRVIDVTPVLEHSSRQHEVNAWRTHNRHVGPFAVLDDTAKEYEYDWPHVVLVGRDGLSSKDLVLVDHALKLQMPADGKTTSVPAKREGSALARLVGIGVRR